MFGERLRKIRNSKGLTQKQLGEMLRVSDGAVRMWELNKREPDTKTIFRLAELLEVSVDYLFGRDTDEVNPDIRALFRAGKNLNKEEAKKLRQAAEALFPEAFKNK